MNYNYQPPLHLPSLLPRTARPLWYAKPPYIDKNLLEQEEEEYRRTIKDIAESGNHFKPIGFSQETADDEGEEDDDDDPDDMEESASEEEPEEDEIDEIDEEAGEVTEIDEEYLGS